LTLRPHLSTPPSTSSWPPPHGLTTPPHLGVLPFPAPLPFPPLSKASMRRRTHAPPRPLPLLKRLLHQAIHGRPPSSTALPASPLPPPSYKRASPSPYLLAPPPLYLSSPHFLPSVRSAAPPSWKSRLSPELGCPFCRGRRSPEQASATSTSVSSSCKSVAARRRWLIAGTSPSAGTRASHVYSATTSIQVATPPPRHQ
jgi:hypothetical protein